MKKNAIFLVVRAAAFAIIASAVATTLKAQDFTIRMKMDNGTEGTIYYVSPNAIRKTTPGVNDVIDRLDRGTIIYLDHRSKTYKEISASEARQAIAGGMGNIDPQKKAMMHQMGLDAKPEVSKLGPGESIAGYPTDKYSIKTGMAQGELWITQALQFPATYYRDFNLLAGVSGPFGDMGKISDLHGVILKRTMTISFGGRGGRRITESAVSIEKGSVPSSMFEPPAGYTKVAR